MNMLNIFKEFPETLQIDNIQVHPPSFGDHEVSVFCYFPSCKLLSIYCMSKEVYERINAHTFYGYLSTTFHLPITDADIIEAEAENVQYPF